MMKKSIIVLFCAIISVSLHIPCCCWGDDAACPGVPPAVPAPGSSSNATSNSNTSASTPTGNITAEGQAGSALAGGMNADASGITADTSATEGTNPLIDMTGLTYSEDNPSGAFLPIPHVENVDTDGDGKPDKKITTNTSQDDNGTTITQRTETDGKGQIVKDDTEKKYTDGSSETEHRELNPDGTVTIHGEHIYDPDGHIKETWDGKGDDKGSHIEKKLTDDRGTTDVSTEDRDNNGNVTFSSEHTDTLGTTVQNGHYDDDGNGTTTVLVTNKDGSQEGWTQTQEDAGDGSNNVRTTTTFLDGHQTVTVGPPEEHR